MSNTTPANIYNPTCARFTRDINGNSRLIVSIPDELTVKEAQKLFGGRVATEGQQITLFTPLNNYTPGISLDLIIQIEGSILATLESLKETYQKYITNK